MQQIPSERQTTEAIRAELLRAIFTESHIAIRSVHGAETCMCVGVAVNVNRDTVEVRTGQNVAVTTKIPVEAIRRVDNLDDETDETANNIGESR